MNATTSTDETLRAENAELRARLEEAEEMLRAIRAGEIDALVVQTSGGPKLFTLQGVDAQQNRMRGEMLAQVSDAVIATDLDQNVIFINASAERQMGVRASAVLGRALANIYIERWENPAAEVAMQRALHERGECRCELIHYMHDGRELHVEKSIGTLRALDGTPIGYVKAIRDVTYRKKMEREKSEALRLLDTLLTHAPVGFVFLDRDMRFVRINERLAEINGLSIAEHLGRTVAEIVPTLETTLREVITRILTTGEPVLDHEFAGETAGAPGVTRYWCQSWYPVRDVGGEIMGFGGVVEEITQRKQVAAALEKSEEHLRYALQAAAAGAWDWDIRSDDVVWSPENYKLYDVDPAQGPPRYADWESRLHPEDRDRVNVYARGVLEGQQAEFRMEFRVVSREGTVRWLLGLGRVEYDGDGQPLRMSGLNLDLTDRKRKETVLKISETRYRRLFESAKDGILILDSRTSTITHANPFIAELLGYSLEEMQGKELWQIGLFLDAEASKKAMQELQEKGYIRYEDLPLQTKAGRRIHVEFVSNRYDEDGEAVIQCNIRDISDRKRLEESLRKHAEDLSEADRRKDEFLATLAHELRNPLAAIHVAVQILRMKGPPAQPGLMDIPEVIDQQSGHMIQLVDDLLDVSRVTHGKVVLKRQTVDLVNVIREAAKVACATYGERNHDVKLKLPERPLMVDGDPLRLTQIVSNLLNNSCRYTDAGGVIEISLSCEGERCEQAIVRVRDNGIGISASMLPRVFDTFSQANTSLDRVTARDGGLGIGLALVKSLVEQHGGSVQACSEGLGKGSEFIVRLPALLAERGMFNILCSD